MAASQLSQYDTLDDYKRFICVCGMAFGTAWTMRLTILGSMAESQDERYQSYLLNC